MITTTSFAMTTPERRAYLQWMQTELSDVPAWNAWQERTGELPPDFDALPQRNLLPDPLRFLDGRPVTEQEDWAARREEILENYQHYAWGQMPPKPALRGVEQVDVIAGEGYSVRHILLQVGTETSAELRVQVALPDGRGPFPVVVTPWLGNWTSFLIPRGYAAVSYAGNDFGDDTAALAELYPDSEVAKLPRRAWAVQPVLDYLETLPEINMDQVALYGYSRDGKLATIAAAWDERIDAVIAGSTGIGGVLPWRLMGEYGMGEGIESTAMMFPDWFHPRLRFFAGHEDRLPIDANLLVAAIAPRACLIQYGLNDEVSSSWALERSYDSALRVYQLLGHPERLGLLREPGFHGSIDPDACLDWLDLQFGRRPRQEWDNERLFAWSFAAWKARRFPHFDVQQYPRHEPNASLLRVANGTSIRDARQWEAQAGRIRKAVEEMLGTPPPQPPAPAPFFGPSGPTPGPTHAEGKGPGQLAPDVPAWVIGRGIQEFGWTDTDNAAVDSVRLRFGHGLHGDLYFPKERTEGEKLPTVIWLHGYSYPLGYMWVYRRDLHPILALTRAGYAVLAFDQSGFGSRQGEAEPFYERYPDWSRLGRMVDDVRAAMDALEDQEMVDSTRIYAFGYTLGGMVALHATALDERLAGVVSIAGFTPMRTDTADSGTGGIARFSHQHSLLPRLDLFVGEETRIPYDYDALLAAIAPRPVLVVQPEMGRGASVSDVQSATDRAAAVFRLYDAEQDLELLIPHGYTRLTESTQSAVIDWMQAHLP